MQSLSFEHINQPSAGSLKSKNQFVAHRRDNMNRQKVLAAVRDWEKTIPGQAQDIITQLVAEAWAVQGGRGITVNKLNLFRYLRNDSGSEKYNGYVMQLAPAIAAAMPIEIAREYGLRRGKTEAELVASAMKECSEAHTAKLLGAPMAKLKKEVIEAQIALSEMLPEEISSPLLAFLSTFAQQCF